MNARVLLLSTALGALMVAAAAVQAPRTGLIAAVAAAAMVAAGIRYRTAATLAVLLVAAALAISSAGATAAALAGLLAVAYLVSRHAAGPPHGIVAATWPTALGAVGFAVLGLAATTVRLELPWLPVAAPLAVFGVYWLATRDYVPERDERG